MFFRIGNRIGLIIIKIELVISNYSNFAVIELSNPYTIYSMKKYLIKVNNKQYEVEVDEIRPGASNGRVLSSAPKMSKNLSSEAIKTPKSVNGGKSVTAPMPGNILKVLVSEGETVSKNQPLLVFEAMKMEYKLSAPADGVVTKLNVKEGSVMTVGEVLVVIE